MSLKLVRLFVLFSLLIGNSMEVKIKCEFRDLFYWNYKCIVKNIYEVDERELTSVLGRHEEGGDNDNVRRIDFSITEIEKNFEKLKYFPGNISSFFPNLREIFISVENDIEEISAKDLEPFSELDMFSLKKSKIRSLPGDLFKYNKNLMEIGFMWNNQLEHIGSNLFDNLPHLTWIWFYENKCIDHLSIEKLDEINKEKLLKECPPASDPKEGKETTTSIIEIESESTALIATPEVKSTTPKIEIEVKITTLEMLPETGNSASMFKPSKIFATILIFLKSLHVLSNQI